MAFPNSSGANASWRGGSEVFGAPWSGTFGVVYKGEKDIGYRILVVVKEQSTFSYLLSSVAQFIKCAVRRESFK